MIVEHADLKFAHETLRSFVDTVALSRAIGEIDSRPYSFTVAANAAFNEAVNSWCILFGNDDADHQQIHWKQMFPEDEFRAELLFHIGMLFGEWRAYRQQVVNYRNELTAHRDLNPKSAFHPNFETALEAADYYHDRLLNRALAEGVAICGPSLIEQYEDRLALFRDQLAVAIAAVEASYRSNRNRSSFTS